MSDDIDKLKETVFDLTKRVDKIRRGDGVWCSFFGKEKEVKNMLRSPSPEINTCNECVEKAYQLIHQDN